MQLHFCVNPYTNSKAVSTPVPVANRTLAYRALESGLCAHEIKIDWPQPERDRSDQNAVSTLRPEHKRY